jgi:hypothetical protein
MRAPHRIDCPASRTVPRDKINFSCRQQRLARALASR